jgi:transcription-repair coupling factor (superfamily II helicase)
VGVQGLADLVLEDKVLAAAVEDARSGAVPALDLTGPPALRPFVVRGLVDAGRTVLAVAATAREAEDLVEALGSLMDPALVGYYPSWETLPHERLSPRSDTVGRRLAVLRPSCTPATTRPTARSRSSSPRSGRCCSLRSRGWPTSSRSS